MKLRRSDPDLMQSYLIGKYDFADLNYSVRNIIKIGTFALHQTVNFPFLRGESWVFALGSQRINYGVLNLRSSQSKHWKGWEQLPFD